MLQDKAVPIPEKMSEWAPRPPPEFVRDVMGNVCVCVCVCVCVNTVFKV